MHDHLAAAAFPEGLSIDGLVPGGIVEPRSAAETAEVLAQAQAGHAAVAPIGGRTALALGNLPQRVDLALSMRGMTKVLAYVPTDLVISVEAGATINEVNAALAERGQTLPIDPPDGDQATIGGLIVTAITGPKRLGHGSLRDMLIGISAAHPSGTVTKAGGMVVKNVTGYDLSRVYHGSLGTLGVITSANFRVLPLPRHRATVVGTFATMDAALAAANRVRQSRVPPVALECLQVDSAWQTATLLEGQERMLDALATELRGLYGADTEVHAAEASDGWWNHFRIHRSLIVSSNEAVIRAAVRPSGTAALGAAVVGSIANIPIHVEGFSLSPGLGTATLRVSADGDVAGAHIGVLMNALSAVAENVTLMAAPPQWKRGIDVWGAVPETLDVMEALKAQFDPQRVLNPGRFAGGI